MIAVVKCVVAVVLSWQIFGFVMKNSEDSDKELLSVVVMFRHGDQSPTTSFPNDPYFHPTYWPMGRGQLTNKGKSRHYDLGKWLRTRYSSFLPEEYSPKDIYVQSTDVDCSLMSATANLAGLYPPKGAQIWSNDLPWQPIPVHTVAKNEDHVLYRNNINVCPKYIRLYNETYNAELFRNINEQYSEFYKYVSTLTGWYITDVHYFAQLKSILYLYSQHNPFFLPAWAESIEMDKVNYLAGLSYARYSFTKDLRRLYDGPFYHYILRTLDNMLSNSSPKFLMLSTDQSTMTSVLNDMGTYDYKAPEFASCLILEVRKNVTGDRYVRLFYKKNSMSPAEELQIEGCGPGCSYKRFKDTLEPISVDLTTWSKECEADAAAQTGADKEPVVDGETGTDGQSGADGDAWAGGVSQPGTEGEPGASEEAGADGEPGVDGESELNEKPGMNCELGVDEESGADGESEAGWHPGVDGESSTDRDPGETLADGESTMDGEPVTDEANGETGAGEEAEADGEPGVDGELELNEKPGMNCELGVDVESGADGEPGAVEEPGTDGVPGASGEPEAGWHPGVDGESSTDRDPGATLAGGESAMDGELVTDGANGETGAFEEAGGDGEPGAHGESELNERPGMNCESGVDEESGADGEPGAVEEPDVDGEPGTDGVPGANGEPEAGWHPGVDGESSTDRDPGATLAGGESAMDGEPVTDGANEETGAGETPVVDGETGTDGKWGNDGAPWRPILVDGVPQVVVGPVVDWEPVTNGEQGAYGESSADVEAGADWDAGIDEEALASGNCIRLSCDYICVALRNVTSGANTDMAISAQKVELDCVLRRLWKRGCPCTLYKKESGADGMPGGDEGAGTSGNCPRRSCAQSCAALKDVIFSKDAANALLAPNRELNCTLQGLRRRGCSCMLYPKKGALKRLHSRNGV